MKRLFSLSWWNLRAVGEIRVLRVSYLAIAFVPLLARAEDLIEQLAISKTILAVSYFGSVFLMSSTFLYDAFCPVVVKRFESPNDYFKSLVDLNERSHAAGVRDFALPSHEDAVTKYHAMAGSIAWVRRTCLILYLLGGGCVAFLLLQRSWLVIRLFLP